MSVALVTFQSHNPEVFAKTNVMNVFLFSCSNFIVLGLVFKCLTCFEVFGFFFVFFVGRGIARVHVRVHVCVCACSYRHTLCAHVWRQKFTPNVF